MSVTPLQSQLERLARLDIGEALFAAPLSDYCTWRIGGPADLLVQPSSIPQIQAVVYFARRHQIPLLAIGQGSNLLFADAGVRGIVLRLGVRFASLTIDGTRIVADGGVWVPGLARTAQRRGLAGLEHLVGIPGTIGGLVLMNGGSRRRGIGENVRRVWIVNHDGAVEVLSAAECRFSYRSSALQGSGAIVARVELECESGDPRLIRREMLADLRERRGKFPLDQPNCGSVFLSTAEMHATVGPPGKIVEEAGLKGTRIGGAEISLKHGNFIVNTGAATARDTLALIAHVRKTIRSRIGYELGCEVRYVTSDATVIPAHLACGE